MYNFYLKDSNGRVVDGNVKCNDDTVTVKFDAQSVKNLSDRVIITSNIWESKVGDSGYILCGADFSRYTSFLTRFIERADFSIEKSRGIIGAFGISNENICCLGIVVGMKYEYRQIIEKTGDTYHFKICYDLDKIDIYEDIEILLYKLPVNSTYLDMAKKYREYMLSDGKCRTIKEKIKSRPELEQIRDSIEIRIRMAWKPAPADVMEQTEENEPPIFVACTFDRVREFVKRLKEIGVEKVQICLVGWNKSGHDGRWPDAFPVEPLLGGEKKLRELIEYTKSCGYNIVCHTNSTDCYSISKRFKNNITLKNKQMEAVADKCIWSGGRMYHLCPQKAWEFAKEDLIKIKDLGFVGAHYVDVMSIIPLRTCFDPSHPCNAKQTDEYFEKIAMLSQELFGGFASEGSFDHSARYLDLGLYTKFNRPKVEGMDEGVNFFEIVFHGITMSNASSQTVNYPIKDEDQRLIMAELNYRPAMYVYSKFKKDGKSWMGDSDLTISTDDDLMKTAEIVKRTADEYSRLSHLQNEFIENYTEIAPMVYRVEYSDNTVITVNYNSEEVDLEYMKMDGKSYVVNENN